MTSLDKMDYPEISISNPDLTDAERQTVLFSDELTEDQAGSDYHATYAEPGISK